MGNKNQVDRTSVPRHGWGGDLNRRDTILKYRMDEQVEIESNPNKFAEEPVISKEDMLLLEQMQK